MLNIDYKLQNHLKHNCNYNYNYNYNDFLAVMYIYIYSIISFFPFDICIIFI